MQRVAHHSWSQRSEAPFRRRTVALVLVLAAHALLVLVLMRLAPPAPAAGPTVTPFELLPERQEHERAAEKPKPVRSESRRQERRAQPVPPPVEQPYKLNIIELTPQEYAASDIASHASQPRTAPDADDAADSASSASASRGPHGERLYDAEWYRKPTQAELAYYLPRGGTPAGWAMIACQTVDDYRVDNCVELEESPAGSGLAAAINKAAWQFRVWPPRLGGRTLVGAWVRIRIEFTQT
jgi:protein TonB